MAKKQLDLNAPLLSARRYSSPSHSSELVKRKVLEKPQPSRHKSLPSKRSQNCQYDDVCKPAAVPFHWEQIPGRPKDETDNRSQTPIEPSTTPRLPPGRISGEITPRPPPGRFSGPSRYASGERSNDYNVSRPHTDAFSFSDHATLLQKLNESLNCRDESDSESEDEEAYSDALDTLSFTGSWSVSGLSGYNSSGVKPSGTFCVDTQTRDFMMNRFLPAAKAAVIETPKKQQAVVSNEQESKRPMRKAISGELKKPSLSNAVPYYSRYIVDNVESEDDVPESRVPMKKSGKTWGILPKFCVKSSLCLLNPLPGLKSKSRAPSPSTREVRRLTRNALSGPLDKNASPVPHQKKFHSGLLNRDMPRIENRVGSSSVGVSPLRRHRSGSISPYRNESPKSPFREGVGFLGVPREIENVNANKIASSRKLFKALQDVSKNQINEKGSLDPMVDVVEKTVYIDSVNRKEDTSKLNILDEEKRLTSPEFRLTDKVCDEVEDVKLNQSVDVKFGMKEEEKVELISGGESDSLMKSPLPPPLPKSPSESWLWRTLPSISLGNPFAHSRRSMNVQSKKQGQKGSSAIDAKWETIVKTSNLKRDQVRFSEELSSHSSHRQSKS